MIEILKAAKEKKNYFIHKERNIIITDRMSETMQTRKQ